MRLEFTLNHHPLALEELPDELSLLDLLREVLDLTGTKRGCDTGACGACAVLVDGKFTRACRTPAAKVAGFCTPGMIIAAEALLLKNPLPSREEIRKALSGNLCRCTGYQQIVDAIEVTAQRRAAVQQGA